MTTYNKRSEQLKRTTSQVEIKLDESKTERLSKKSLRGRMRLKENRKNQKNQKNQKKKKLNRSSKLKSLLAEYALELKRTQAITAFAKEAHASKRCCGNAYPDATIEDTDVTDGTTGLMRGTPLRRSATLMILPTFSVEGFELNTSH